MTRVTDEMIEAYASAIEPIIRSVCSDGNSDCRRVARECAQAALSLASGDKIAPVQGYADGIPWSMHLRAYDAYCKKWSPQPAMIDLEGRNCRGGFGVKELDEFIPGWREELSEISKLKAEVARLTTALASPPAPVSRSAGDALRTAIGHIEHMAAWIGKQNAGYSFESLSEDMPGIREALTERK